MIDLDDREVRDRLRLAIHDEHCRPGCPAREHCSFRWAAHVHGWREAALHLLDHPRDAAGARLILHDAVCMSHAVGEDTPEQGREHANRTQTETVRAMRKWLAAEKERAAS